MLDGCAIGDVFQSPSAEQMLAVTRHIDQGKGVLYIYGNYNGDIFNFDSAAEMADFEENIRVESCVAGEDVAGPAPEPGEANKRRGVAGIFFVFKCAGAAAAAGLDLDNVKRVADKVCQNVRTMGVALTSCTVPRVGRPSFIIAEDEMEIGMGIHGERACDAGAAGGGRDRGRKCSRRCLPTCPTKAGTRSPCWSTAWARTPADTVLVRDVPPRKRVLGEKGIKVCRTYVGEYATLFQWIWRGLHFSCLRFERGASRYLSAPADNARI
jgi:dihydroxyacetone kinase-like protein